MKNYKESLQGVPADLRKKILKMIRALHMSRNAAEFTARLNRFGNFLFQNNLQQFWDYFMTTWVNSQHSRWCIFDTDPGVGNTNNAVESFNRHFKREVFEQQKVCVG